MIGFDNMNCMLSIQNIYQIKINNKYYKTNHINYSKLKYKYVSRPVDKTWNPLCYNCFRIQFILKYYVVYD